MSRSIYWAEWSGVELSVDKLREHGFSARTPFPLGHATSSCWKPNGTACGRRSNQCCRWCSCLKSQKHASHVQNHFISKEPSLACKSPSELPSLDWEYSFPWALRLFIPWSQPCWTENNQPQPEQEFGQNSSPPQREASTPEAAQGEKTQS